MCTEMTKPLQCYTQITHAYSGTGILCIHSGLFTQTKIIATNSAQYYSDRWVILRANMVWGFTTGSSVWSNIWYLAHGTEWSCLQSLWKMSSWEIIPVVINHHLECVWVCLGGGMFHSSRAKKTESRLVLLQSVSASELWWSGSSQFDSWKTNSQGRRLEGKIWMIQGPQSWKALGTL